MWSTDLGHLKLRDLHHHRLGLAVDEHRNRLAWLLLLLLQGDCTNCGGGLHPTRPAVVCGRLCKSDKRDVGARQEVVGLARLLQYRWLLR
jgi:hypothetical protein